MRVAIYARVSTDDKGQEPGNQLREAIVPSVSPTTRSNKKICCNAECRLLMWWTAPAPGDESP
jgi:hypothetical protein